MIKTFFFFIKHSSLSLSSSGRIDNSRAYGLAGLLQGMGAAFTHIQLVADQKAPVAHKPPAEAPRVKKHKDPCPFLSYRPRPQKSLAQVIVFGKQIPIYRSV
jgi:hypothetical protein